MTRSLMRSLLLCSLVAIVPASLYAQTATPTPTPTQTAKPTPSSSPRLTPTPLPTPTLDQRFERPTPSPLPDPARFERESRWNRFYRPTIRIGQSYTLRAGEESREVVVILGDVRVEGHVERDLVVVMGSATLASTAVVDGSLVVVGGSATVEKGAVVDDDVVVIGGTLEAPADFSTRGEHVVIGSPAIGAMLQGLVPWFTRGLLLGRLIVPDLMWNWIVVAIAFVIGLMLNKIFSRQVTACIDVLERRPVSAFLMGLLMMLLAPIILALVAASIVGLLVVPFAFFAFVLAAMIGKVGVTRIVGRTIVNEGEPGLGARGLATYAVGSVVLILAYMLPVLGLLTWATVGVFGFGSATMAFAATLRRERPVPPPRDPTAPVTPEPPPAPPAPAPAPAAMSGAAASAGAHETFATTGEPSPAAATAGVPLSQAAPGFPRSASDLSMYPRATFLDRAAAIALDAVLVAIAVSFFDHAWDDGSPFVAILLLYHVAFWTWKGTTLGGIICNVRVARLTSTGAESDIRFVDALVRGLSSIFSVAALGIGCLWMLTDRDSQMWHDKIAGTIVVKVPRELVLA